MERVEGVEGVDKEKEGNVYNSHSDNIYNSHSNSVYNSHGSKDSKAKSVLGINRLSENPSYDDVFEVDVYLVLKIQNR